MHWILHFLNRNAVWETHAAYCAGMSPFSRDTGPFKQDWIVQKKGYTASERNMGSLEECRVFAGILLLERIPHCLKWRLELINELRAFQQQGMLHLHGEYSIFVVGMRHVENQAGRKANILKLGPRFFKKNIISFKDGMRNVLHGWWKVCSCGCFRIV